MSDFKVGDEVFVRGTVREVTENGLILHYTTPQHIPTRSEVQSLYESIVSGYDIMHYELFDDFIDELISKCGLPIREDSDE